MRARRRGAPDPTDVESIDAIVTAAYDGISGPAGKKRDWDRERSLYFPGARLIPTAMKAGGPPSRDSRVAGENVDLAPQILDIDGFIARVEPFFEKGFYEKEIARRTEQFGNIAHVWSIYESRHNEDDPEPFMRGINSHSAIQRRKALVDREHLLAAGVRLII